MIFSTKMLFGALLVYLGWMAVSSYAKTAGNIYVLLLILASLMYNRDGLQKELQTLGVI